MARIVSSDTRLGFFFLCIVLAWATTAHADGNATATPTPSPTLSGCQVCASTGDCSHAYLDSPGQFCGNWLDKASQRQRCCCPREAICRVSNYECRCSLKTATPAPTVAVSTGGWAGIGVGGFMFLACCIGSCWCMHRAITRNRNNLRPPQYATATPMVYGQPPCNVAPIDGPHGVVYGAPPVQYPYAGVPTAPTYGYGYGNSYGHHHHSSGMGAGLGAVAGLVTGMVVADAVFDSGHHHGDYGGGGGGYDGGGGGGFDGGGDSGGGGGDFGGDF